MSSTFEPMPRRPRLSSCGPPPGPHLERTHGVAPRCSPIAASPTGDGCAKWNHLDRELLLPPNDERVLDRVVLRYDHPRPPRFRREAGPSFFSGSRRVRCRSCVRHPIRFTHDHWVFTVLHGRIRCSGVRSPPRRIPTRGFDANHPDPSIPRPALERIELENLFALRTIVVRAPCALTVTNLHAPTSIDQNRDPVWFHAFPREARASVPEMQMKRMQKKNRTYRCRDPNLEVLLFASSLEYDHAATPTQARTMINHTHPGKWSLPDQIEDLRNQPEDPGYQATIG